MTRTIKELNIVISGVGGQGSILLSHITGNAAIKEGYRVKVAETYGGSMRGGSVLGQIRIGTDVLGPLILEDKADILLALEPVEGLRVGVKYLSPNAIAIINTRPLKPMDVNVGMAKYPNIEKITESLRKLCKEVVSIDATQLAEKAGSPKTLNTVMLGALAAVKKLPISMKTLVETMKEHAPKGTEEMNVRAFELGYNAIKKSTSN